MKYYDYNELRNKIIIEDRYREKFREQTDLERNKLKEGLIYHQRVLEPLKVSLRFSGVVLIDGHHRWKLLPEVIKECPDFDLNIPVVLIKSKDVADEMLRTQLGRRNLSNGEIAQYVNSLQQQGLNKKPAIKQTANELNIPVNQVKNAVYPNRAEKDRQRALVKSKQSVRSSAPNQPQSIEISLEEKERRSEKQRQNRINRKMGKTQSTNSDYYKEFKDNLLDTKQLVEYEDKDYYDEVLANGSKYRTYKNTDDYLNSEEYISGAPVNSNNQHTSVPECERLILIKELIDSLKDHLPFFEDSPIHSDIHKLIENYTFRVNLLKK